MKTRSDIDRIFQQFNQPKPFRSKLKSGFILTIQFLILFAFFFSILNFPAYYTRLEYFVQTKILKTQPRDPVLAQVEKTIERTRPLPEVAGVKSNVLANATSTTDGQNTQDSQIPNLPNNRLYIPKINVNTPIIWEVPIESMINELRQGVTHYKDTALPGRNGNVVITGHSSNFWWDPGEYKQVFALLDKLQSGDTIVATYQNQPYIYEVERTFVVNPNQIEILNPLDHSVITLLTCTPVGTTINRLIVQAKQISPIAGAIEQTPQLPKLPNSLPNVR